jgi:aldose 1-epimerase
MTFGQMDGKEVGLYTLTSAAVLRAAVTPYGARLVQLWVPDRNGTLGDVVLGHDRLEDYVTHPTYFGATCGRYANRIAGGRFTLDGVTYQLDLNEGANHLHGGQSGFDRKLWAVKDSGPSHITLQTTSPDGEMGYPGACDLQVTYRFDGEHFVIEMTARTDAPTVINMVNHAYFNLAGSGDVLDHVMQVNGETYTPVTADLLTTGEVRAVAATGFDFRKARSLRDAMADLPDGYDHNWCLGGSGPAVTLTDPASGRRLRLWTDQPGVQIYTCGQMRTPVPGKAGAVYGRFAGLTLETQRYPCSPNHPHFPSAVLRPGKVYAHRMELAFDTVPLPTPPRT